MGRAGGRRAPRERCGLHPPELYTLQFSQAGTRPLTVPEYFRMNQIHLWCVHFFLKLFIYLFQLEANYFTILWWVLPYIDMNQQWVDMCPHPDPPSHLPPHPIPQGHPSATSPEHPASCIEPGLVIYFTYVNIHVSMLFSQIIPPLPYPTESKSLFFTSVSLLLSHI